LKKYKSPGTDQIPVELIEAGGETIPSVTHKHSNSLLNKEELSDHWKEYIIVPVYKKGIETDHSNYGGISLLSTSNKIVFHIVIYSGRRL
jgi:hypothetical protein